ncbi:hypothetical protein [Alcanivorax sp.]|uniref:hypothetical protein n=1 Tax=Alcanivorax sp. TaxID=1872427 RepID=UPI0025C2C516|nr:hypothetical protein [Alcanivorax sp.]
MKSFFKKLGRSIQKRTNKNSVTVLLACILLAVGVPAQQAVQAGKVGGAVYETVKGDDDHGSEETSQ